MQLLYLEKMQGVAVEGGIIDVLGDQCPHVIAGFERPHGGVIYGSYGHFIKVGIDIGDLQEAKALLLIVALPVGDIDK